MYFTTATNATNLPITYLPANTNYGDVLNQNAQWTTSSYDILNEHGMAVLEQITKVHNMMTKYAGLINGVIFEELTKRLSDLFFKVNCQWGYWAGTSTLTTPVNTWTTTLPYIPSTGNTYIDNKYIWYTIGDQITTRTVTSIPYIGSTVYTY